MTAMLKAPSLSDTNGTSKSAHREMKMSRFRWQMVTVGGSIVK